jgi:hypothetical protein
MSPDHRPPISRFERWAATVPVIVLLATILWNVAQSSRKQDEMQNSLLEIKTWMASRDERWSATNLDVKSLGIELRGDMEQVKYRVGVLEQANARTIPYRKGQ